MKLSFPPSIHVSGRWVHGWQKASRCKHHARAHLLFLVQPECDPHVNKILPKHFSPHKFIFSASILLFTPWTMLVLFFW
jgi:hypothetical protein